MKISIIDTGIANLSSVVNAFKILECEYEFISCKNDFKNASFLVLPGVGSFKSAMEKIEEKDYANQIINRVQRDGLPIIGICLGMQLLFDKSSEFGSHKGLGLVKGDVKKLVSYNEQYRVPNIGWNDVFFEKKCKMFPNNTKKSEDFYHVHSYYANCDNKSDQSGTIEFSGQKVCVAVEKENIFGVQFHPEKSQDNGLNLLNNIISSYK